MPLKSTLFQRVNALAHNLIHILCVELWPQWKSAVLPGNRAAKTGLLHACYIFTQSNINDINQGTWRISLRLRTILSTDCVQNFRAAKGDWCRQAAFFLLSDIILF
jgi:hypothetical protein